MNAHIHSGYRLFPKQINESCHLSVCNCHGVLASHTPPPLRRPSIVRPLLDILELVSWSAERPIRGRDAAWAAQYPINATERDGNSSPILIGSEWHIPLRSLFITLLRFSR